MISLRIKDTKNLMNSLLLNNTFDFFNLYEANISTFCSFSINGHLIHNHYSEEELSELSSTDFSSWAQIKPICFNLIKGSKLPESLKITLCLPQSHYEKCVQSSGAPLSVDNITGLYLHIHYENSKVTAITGTSINIFTMDKSLDEYWDSTISAFLTKHFDVDIL